MKVCVKCNKEKGLNDFYKAKNLKGGYAYICKSCQIIATQKARDIRCKDQREKRKVIKSQIKKRVELEKLEALKRKAQREHNKKVLDPFKRSMRARIHYALDKKTKQSKNNKRIYLYEILLGCSYEDLIKHIESQFIKGMNWENKGLWETDHIIPLASANTVEELYVLFHYTNIQPLWHYRNIKKRSKIPLVSNVYFHNNDINKRIEYIKKQHERYIKKYSNYKGRRYNL